MLSRTADHLFWMSRYTERAENTARMLNVSYETSLQHLLCVHQKAAEGRLSPQHSVRAQRVRGSLPGEETC